MLELKLQNEAKGFQLKCFSLKSYGKISHFQFLYLYVVCFNANSNGLIETCSGAHTPHNEPLD